MKPLYTGQGPTEDFSLAGPLAIMLEVGQTLHEQTPFLNAVYYPDPPFAVMITRVDAGRGRSVRWLRDYFGPGEIEIKPVNAVSMEVLQKYPIGGPFTLAVMPHAPYRGKLPTQPLRWRQTAGDYEAFYSFADTPTAEIAQLLDPFVPTYSYQAQHTCITYAHLVGAPRTADLRTYQLTQLFPGLELARSRGLPYESTCVHSPRQRLIDIPKYL